METAAPRSSSSRWRCGSGAVAIAKWLKHCEAAPDVESAWRRTSKRGCWQEQSGVSFAHASVEEMSQGDSTAAAQRLQAVADISSLATTQEAQALAELLLKSKAVPANSARDALHIAIAATQGAEYLLTSNFKHINNAETRELIS